MSKHTPGPWRPLLDFPTTARIENESGDTVCVLGRLDSTFEARRADATLIAAAPDLLEAAKEALDRLTGVTGVPNPVPTLKAAIAKAEGRS